MKLEQELRNEIIEEQESIKKECIKRCPLGGMCFNPMCVFGCVEY